MFSGKGFCDQPSLRHPTPSLSCRVTVCGRDRSSEESGTEESISVSVSPSIPPCGPWGLWGRCPGAVDASPRARHRGWLHPAPPECPPPFSQDVKPTVPRGLLVEDAVGKKPFLPSEMWGGCKRGLSVHPRGCGSGLSPLPLRCGPHTRGCWLPDGLGSLLRRSWGPSWVTRTCNDEYL